jgi:hypothetical protein
MRLFDEGTRTELRLADKSEPTYSYYNQSARPAIVALRQLLEDWFERTPDQAKCHLRARFQSPLESNHQGAFFELYIHELFTCLGFELQIDPSVPGHGTHPDFLVLRGGVRQFYIEATVAGLPFQDEQGAIARMATVYDAINTVFSPNFFLRLKLRGSPKTPPPTRRLRDDLTKWLQQLNPDLILQLYAEKRYGDIPSFDWSYEGWDLSFEPLPKSAEFRGRLGVRPIGIETPEGKWLNTQGVIRAGIERKSNKYGNLHLPFVVATNVVENHCENIDIMNALYGDERFIVTGYDGHLATKEGTRTPNGAWGTSQSVRNKLVSGVLIFRDLNPWNMRVVNPEFFHHPWCLHPIPTDISGSSRSAY